MLAMQYSIPLPADYDDKLITQRVEQRSKLFDDLDGLLHKAFLYNAKDKLYAPFYVWQNMAQARQFLLDQLFRGVMESFKRPRVRNWVVVDQAYGNRNLRPTHAIREIDAIPAGQDIESLLKAEQASQQEMLKDENLYYHLTAIDPDRWEIIRYHLWLNAASAPKLGSDCIQTYDVLHVSEPNAVNIKAA
jgi:hypothetical protein